MEDPMNEFTRKLVELVRDRSIRNCDATLLPHIGGQEAEKWKSLIAGGDTHALVQRVIADTVDTTISQLLSVIDSGEFKLAYHAESGKLIDLEVEGLGEMVGWYLGTESWRHQYSQERFNDYTVGLSLNWDDWKD